MTEPRYAYVLSSRGENGQDMMAATLDRTALPDMLRANWRGRRSLGEAETTLRQLLGFADADLAQQVGHRLHRCYGANETKRGHVRLHVLRVG